MGKKIVDEDMRLNIKINGNEAKNELFELEEKVRDLRAENDKLEKSIDKYGKQIERNEKQVAKYTKTLEKERENVERQEKTYASARSSITAMYATYKKLDQAGKESKYGQRLLEDIRKQEEIIRRSGEAGRKSVLAVENLEKSLKRLEAENGQLKQDIADLQERVKAEQAEQKNMEHRHCSEINKIYRAHQQETMQYDERLKRIDTYFPHVKELLPIADQCREMGFTEEMTRQLVCFKPVGFRGKLYSKEHGKEFKTERSTATIEKNPQQAGKFRLCIDGMPLLEWFKMKFQELKEKLGVSHTQKEEPRKGLRM